MNISSSQLLLIIFIVGVFGGRSLLISSVRLKQSQKLVGATLFDLCTVMHFNVSLLGSDVSYKIFFWLLVEFARKEIT